MDAEKERVARSVAITSLVAEYACDVHRLWKNQTPLDGGFFIIIQKKGGMRVTEITMTTIQTEIYAVVWSGIVVVDVYVLNLN